MSITDETTALALDARDGDRFALAAFVKATEADVWRLCSRLVDRSSADDLVQEVYVRAMRSLPAFEGRSSARTWLLTIARRTCADAIRRRVRRRRLLARTVLQREQEEPDPVGLATVEALVEALPQDRREAFVLTQVLGLPYAEAAEVCGCPVGTIRSRVARAREELISQLEDLPPGARRD